MLGFSLRVEVILFDIQITLSMISFSYILDPECESDGTTAIVLKEFAHEHALVLFIIIAFSLVGKPLL